MSTILFTPYINNIFSNNNNKINRYRMRLKLIKSECNHDLYRNSEIWFKFGIIGMPKLLSNNNKSINLLKLKNIFENIYKIENDNFDLFDIYYTFNEPFDKIETYSVELFQKSNTNAKDERTYLNHSNKLNYATDYHLISSNVVNDFSFKVNDFIDICIEHNSDNNYYNLYL